jgi:putative endonuclease
MKQAEHLKVGRLGENIAAEWLGNTGFLIKDRHYLRKWGEIDLIAARAGIVHFVEVKTVSYETMEELDNAVAHGMFRPEENVHEAKLKRLYRAIESWIGEKKYKGEYQLDVLTVRMVPREKYAVLDLIENVTLS